MKIGFIGGGGAMAKPYAKAFLDKKYEVLVSDINKESLEAFDGTKAIICDDNIQLVENSDLAIYSVPIPKTVDIIKESAPYLKEGATIGGFTSTKTLEVIALETYAPESAKITTFHPMHGPSLSPEKQRFIIIPIRDEEKGRKKIEKAFKSLGVDIAYLPSAQVHDKIMADTQILTHFTYLNKFRAWRLLKLHPTEHEINQNEIDRIEGLQALRIGGGNPEVYAGIAIYNPYGGKYVEEYLNSLDEIMELIIKGEKNKLLELWKEVADYLGKDEIERSDKVLASLFEKEYVVKDQTNSELGQIVLGRTCQKLKINLKDNIAFQSPPYRIRSLITHKILGSDAEQFINNMINNKETQWHDHNFCKAAWAFGEAVKFGNYQGFVDMIEETKKWFGKEELKKAQTETDALIKKLVGV